MPVEIITQLAEPPNIIGIKESGGSLEKIERLVQSTGHVQYEVPVTEVFTAVTARMQAEEKAPENVVPVESLSATTTAVVTRPKLKTRTKNAGFQVLCGSAHQLLNALEKGAAGGLVSFFFLSPHPCVADFIPCEEREPKAGEKKKTHTHPAN